MRSFAPLSFAVMAVACSSAHRPPASGDPGLRIGGEWRELAPEQRRLLEDMYARFNALGGLQLDAATDYDQRAPISLRTTYEAVTHALLTTELSDEAGRSLGVALDLVRQVDGVHGIVEGERGDLQFRIYVELVDDAIDRLERSRQFERKRDNTKYHRGYPLNYRQDGGAPSLQISISRDGRWADIDVDYRSSSLPAALFNGHLTAANSDVRASDNHERHSQRWSGFIDWWVRLFGGRLVSPPEDPRRAADWSLPRAPRGGDGEVWEAAHDFLRAWLIEDAPNQAVAYIARDAYHCRLPAESGARSDLGMVPYQIMLAMDGSVRGAGARVDLTGLAFALTAEREGLRGVQHPYGAHFSLYQIPDDLAFDLDCRTRLGGRRGEERPKPKYGRHYLAVAHIALPSEPDVSLAMIWAKAPKSWRIVSWLEAADLRRDRIPVLHEAPEVVMTAGSAPPDLIARTRAFHEGWLLRADVEATLAMFSPRSYPCVNRVVEAGEGSYRDRDAQRSRLRAGLRRTAERMRVADRLADLIDADRPAHDDLQVVAHELDDTYSLAAVSEALARGLLCEGDAGRSPTEHYLTGFVADVEGGGEAVLNVLWGHEGGRWQVQGFDVEVP